ncbi:MAG: xanthine dehydrogenase family protein subunit M [Deltaproteobacteria bacterium]|nr:xanthine dehydrogenase family protein subunit M [Deltaproteobacteria bacterium]RLA91030.1 MAG: xanthine dehydrogenase family protein subunit M [Deltaproteobacteria bacterium]
MRDFEYIAPKTVKETLDVLDEYQEDCKIIAGGQSLLNILKQGLMAPEYIIDIKNLEELNYIKFDEKDGLKIGATTTHRSVEFSDTIKEHYNVLSEMERHLATVQIRNWGTIGGNLCIADPTGDVAPPLLAMDATVIIANKDGEREVTVLDFGVDYYETVVGPNELLTEIRVPVIPSNTGIAYLKYRIVEGDAPIVGAAVAFTLNEKGACKKARIGMGGVAPIPIRAEKAEKMFEGEKITDTLIEEAAKVASEETTPIPDIVASAEYKKRVIGVYVKRAAKLALTRAEKAAN